MNEVTLARRPLAIVVAAAGCMLLVARPPLLGAVSDPVTVLMLLFVALFAVGVCWPAEPGAKSVSREQIAWMLALGIATFAVGRVLGGGDAPFHTPASAIARLILLNSVAAVAEEAFFRRFVYGTLVPGGAALAVVGSAALFALVHVTIYGWWVLPLDLAAGLVLSWQRWASGSWKVPAVTHVVANILVVI
ncbi:MAG TPA: CPBP family intramembrane glutamic endopeptidase [Acidimicrobiales bacterium]|nr:CPBP family intramembrane glutamic endopeptidase [Acidimicrobiales bacterium]